MTTTTETHKLHVELGYWCWTCHAPTVTRTVSAVADTSTLLLLETIVSATCRVCGHCD